MVQPLWKTLQKFFKKLNKYIMYDPAFLVLDIRMKESICSYKVMYMYSYGNFISNSPKLETNQMPINNR